MLELAEKNHFHFDTVQMPLNVMDAHYRSFEHRVLPVLVSRQIGVLLGMKSMRLERESSGGGGRSRRLNACIMRSTCRPPWSLTELTA